MNAYDDLIKCLSDDEKVEAIVFGPWGWGSSPGEGREWTSGHGEPDPPAVPFCERGKVLTLDEAAPYMEGWEFFGRSDAPYCYATYVWTSERVLWVTQCDGATCLDSAPRNPVEVMPDMPGG